MKPVVAVVGRSNVGKSTLFNRLSRRKKAIVIDEPGVTRDRNYAECNWEGKPFLLIDTGGFEPAATETIMVQMREQTKLAIEEADIVIFLMNGMEGLMPADREIVEKLRGIAKPVFFVVNKVDGPKQEAVVPDFYALGIDKFYVLSALHGLGIGELMEDVAEYLFFSESQTGKMEECKIRIAVVGKPNVGKSSLVNKILGYERTIVNRLPGTTRDAIDTPFNLNDTEYLMIDTAGIRRKSRISLTLEKYSVIQALKTIDRCDVALLLIDAQEGVTEQDTKIAGLVSEKGTACIIVVNKWDLLEKNSHTLNRYAADIRDKIKFMNFAPMIFVSAISGQRVLKIFEIVEMVYEQYTKRVNTAELNRKIREIWHENPPPRHQYKEQQINYVTQISIKPPTFVLFVRDPEGIHFSYERYLLNRMREVFGFDKAPLRLIFRKKR